MRAYFLLTKPGIIFGNLVTATSGFILASKGHIDISLLLETLAGLSFVIASACVFNNAIDREADKKMSRTKNRPLATGALSVQNALRFGTLLGLLGFSLLAFYTNLLATSTAFLGFATYVFLYSFWKYHSSLSTLVGSIAGAVPPAIGYLAVTNRFDTAALLLFAIVCLWQMPHFFSIAIYRLSDYSAAAIPVLPLKRGVLAAKLQMLLYILAFSLATLSLTFYGYTGYAYLFAAILLSATWLFLSFKGFSATNDKLWARKMFLFSLFAIVILCTFISVDGR